MNKNQNPNTTVLTDTIKLIKRPLYFIFFFGFIISMLTIATSIYSLQVFDRVLSSGSMGTLFALTVIMFICLIVLGFIQVIRTSVFIHISNYIDKKLSPKLLEISITNSAVFSGLQGSQNLRDLNVIKSFLTGAGINSLLDAPWALLYIIAIFFIHPLLCLMVCISAAVLLLLAYTNEKATKSSLDKANEMNVKSVKELELATRNAEVIEAMGMKSSVIKNWLSLNQEIVNHQTEASRKSSVISNTTKIFRMMVYALSTGVGAYLVIENRMSPGGIIAASILSGKALAPFDAAIGMWKSVINVRKSYERLNKIFTSSPARQESMQLPEPKGNLELDKVAYVSQTTKKPIIKGINVKINAGEVVGVIGPSGSGKTTLAKLITGIWKPTSGLTRLDGADIYTWNRDDINNHLGYLPQDVELFNGSVKDNIARMNKEADSQKVIDAARSAFVHELILRLPNGYETDIGIAGSQLSAGQRQRIALARAFYNNPKVIILDEPNSNLDQEGDEALAKSIQFAKQNGSTVIVISHRQNIMNVLDKLLVIQNGEAKLFGERDEVLNKLKGNK